MNIQLLTLLFSSLTLVLSTPLTSPKRDFAYQQLNFSFSSGPASYSLSFPADGNDYNTNNPLSISLISPGSFNALYECNFNFLLPATGNPKLPVLTLTGNGNQLAVGPPTPILSVDCEPTEQGGQCLPVYASCEWCLNTGGCYLLDCCSGYCAATKCRPT